MTARILSLPIALALLLLPATGRSQAAAAVFPTPEAAVTHFLAGVAGSDVGRILQACAVDEMAARFDFERQVEGLGGLMILSESLAPSNAPFFRELNRVELSSRVLAQVRRLVLSLLSGEEVSPRPIPNVDPERAAAFVSAVDPERLAGLEIAAIALPDAALMRDPRYLEISAGRAGVYGADELTERVALVAFEQRSFMVGFTLLRYGDGWKIAGQHSPLAGTDPLGAAQETTADAFAQRFASD